jgi:hypothetical protein
VRDQTVAAKRTSAVFARVRHPFFFVQDPKYGSRNVAKAPLTRFFCPAYKPPPLNCALMDRGTAPGLSRNEKLEFCDE